MAADLVAADRLLTQRYLRDDPAEAASTIERAPPATIDELGTRYAIRLAAVVERLTPFLAVELLATADDHLAGQVVAARRPSAGAEVLARVDTERRQRWLALLPSPVKRKLVGLLDCPPDSAGRLMSRPSACSAAT